MIGYKEKFNLVGNVDWPEITSIFINGNPQANKFDTNSSLDNRWETITSWKNVAVLSITAEKPTKFFMGFASMNSIQVLKIPFETDTKIGMRIGKDDIRFFALPINHDDKVLLELVEFTSEDDNRYPDLILI